MTLRSITSSTLHARGAYSARGNQAIGAALHGQSKATRHPGETASPTGESVTTVHNGGESVLAKIVRSVPSSDRGGLSGLRAALVSTLTLAFVAGLTNSADAYYPRRLRYATPYGGWYGDLSARRMRAVSPSRASTAVENAPSRRRMPASATCRKVRCRLRSTSARRK